MRIFSADIGMDFGVTKCVKLAIRKGKVVATEGIKFPDGREIKKLEKGDSYKYLGVLVLDEVQCKDMRMKLTKEYFRRVGNCCDPRLTEEIRSVV